MNTEKKRGYTFDDKEVEKLAVGQSTKKETMDYIGSPSSASVVGSDTWYYISSTLSTAAFSSPKRIDQQVLAITFNDDGVIDKIEKFSGDEKEKLKFNKEKTPSHGTNLSVIQQLLGNVGRFSGVPKPQGGV